uniref:P-type domain-containing protein n=1 Tax=Plectus sambesii TaxID=2011161 RepID=A0A914UQC7_9BILA
MQRFLLLLAVFASLFIAQTVAAYEIRIDCHPDPGASEKNCEQRGCIWLPGPDHVPWCIFNATKPWDFSGYDGISYEQKENFISLLLKRRPTPTLFGNDEEYIRVNISTVRQAHPTNGRQHSNRHVVRIQFSARRIDGLELEPEAMDPMPCTLTFHPKNVVYAVNIQVRPFGYWITAGKKDNIVFDTTNLPGFTYSRQFLQMTARMPTENVYGLGEQFHTQLRQNFNWQRLSLFAKDQAPVSNMNLYGAQPFYLGLDIENAPYGVFLNNVHPMDVFLQPDPELMTFRVIGGDLDLYVFAGFDRPDQVVSEYTALIGRPMMPPMWGLGYQLCRYGYSNLSYLQQVYQRNRNAKIPQDVQYIDIDYMDSRKDFTFDKKRFAGLPQFVQNGLHSEGRKLVLITDPGISTDSDYRPYTDGLAKDVFIKDARTNRPLISKVWPGETVFPDFVSHPDVYDWWRGCLSQFHSELSYDGVWLDMNEPATFVDGSTTGCANNSLNYPPYIPVTYKPFFWTTICLDAHHHSGIHYEHHNVYGHFEAIHTNRALQTVFPGKRPFLVTRSSAPGTGKYSAHWMGDTFSTWESLNQSIVALLEFNMFGIPWAGSDICGFNGDTTQELCLRWSQLGAFYPFSRNHNEIDSKVEQDPAAWPKNTTDAIRNALLIRYSLLPYLYTLFYKAHNTGATVVKPMFFEFPHDPVTHNMHDQFLWGGHLLIVPILAPFTTSRSAYFPKGYWYNVNDGMKQVDSPEKNRWVTLEIPKDSIGLFVRAGCIIPWQHPGESVQLQRKNSFGLTVALAPGEHATGELYWDDGESLVVGSDTSCIVKFQASSSNGTLLLLPKSTGCEQLPLLQVIIITGVTNNVGKVAVNGILVDKKYVSFSSDTHTLTILRASIDMT